MRMGLFGWSLPPGVSTLPGEEDSGLCEVCGGHIDSDKCICPECPICGMFGDERCYERHGLVRTLDQINGRKKAEEMMAKQEEKDKVSFDIKCEFGHTMGKDYDRHEECDYCQNYIYQECGKLFTSGGNK